MRKKIIFSFPFLILLLFSSCQEKKVHFINDKNYRKQVHRDFTEREKIAAGRREQLFSVMDESLSTEEQEAMEFLYAYMPLSDLADYDGDFFLNQVRFAFQARDFFDWGKTIPEDIFRHFVLVYRVNNENLDSARMFIFNEIKDRIKGMSMYDAALEVNHWCHEKVTYRPSDGRTSAPLATIRTAFGRCGEESTLTVTAMRAVGIPARQCYTPRWAHTDDNHAWVEVWVDGKWYFLGACEPDAELNMGWFAAPAKRTMMVHSNVFGKYKGNEEINFETNLYARANMLANYTETKKITVTVIDEKGTIVPDAEVKFKLYNYAEYYPLAVIKTDEKGKASLTTGLGDLLVWASKDGHFGYDIFDVREEEESLIVLKERKTPGVEYVEFFNIKPPVEKAANHSVSQEKIELNNRRLLYEDSLRNAYLKTFMTESEAKKIVNGNLTPDQIWEIIHKSEGNYAEIVKFINQHSEKEDGLLLYDYLKSLSDKDLRDISAITLEQHLTHYHPDDYPLEVYLKGIISPRIANEGVRPWRNYLAEKMPPLLEGEPSPALVMAWMEENFIVDPDANYFNCPISPQGVFELGYTDPRSFDIFFVAACRSLNIPAYKDLATGLLYAYENGNWVNYPVKKDEAEKEQATLVIDYNGNPEVKPEYWIHYTIAKEEDGDFVTFDYENDERVASFPARLELEPGYYILSTGNRYSDGTILSRVEFFNLNAGETTTKQIEIRPLEPREMNYGSIDLEYDVEIASGEKIKAKELLQAETILCFIDPSREPTKHVLKDIANYKEQFEKWGGKMLFMTPSDKVTVGFNSTQWDLPKQSLFMEDMDGRWIKNITSSLDVEWKDNYPLVLIINSEGEITFKSEGYRIGTGELLYKTIQLENR